MSATSVIANSVTAYMNILKNEEVNNSYLKNAFDELVDLIIVRIERENIEDIATALKTKIFDIRLGLINLLSKKNASIENYFDLINEKILTINHAPHHVELFNTQKNILFIFKKIIIEKNIINFKNAQIDFQNNSPNYSAFIFLQSHPNPQTRYFIKWLDESLKLDIGLIIADMIFDKKINLDQKRIQQEIIPFLNKTIDRFGAYSIFTEFWKPDKEDYSPKTYKMQILADIIRINNGIQPLYLENEKDLEDVGLRLVLKEAADVKDYLNTEAFLHQLRGFVVDEGGSGKMIYGNWNNIQETLLLLHDKRTVNALREVHENHENGIINESKTIQEIFVDV